MPHNPDFVGKVASFFRSVLRQRSIVAGLRAFLCQLLMLLVHESCDVFAQDDFVLSEPFRKELLHTDGGLVAELVYEQLVDRLNEPVVALGEQIKLALTNEVRNLGRVDE